MSTCKMKLVLETQIVADGDKNEKGEQVAHGSDVSAEKYRRSALPNLAVLFCRNANMFLVAEDSL